MQPIVEENKISESDIDMEKLVKGTKMPRLIVDPATTRVEHFFVKDREFT